MRLKLDYRMFQCLTLALVLSVPITLTSIDCALARGHKAHMAPKHAEQEEQPEEQQENPEQMQDSNQEQQTQDQPAESNQESPSPEDHSTLSGLASSPLKQLIDDRFRHPETPGGISLFKIVGDFVLLMVLISFFGCIPVAGSVLLCAIVWHVGNTFRGGKKPQIG